jgi:NNP family nitrate/nitrite transporter-like MFS transporter
MDEHVERIHSISTSSGMGGATLDNEMKKDAIAIEIEETSPTSENLLFDPGQADQLECWDPEDEKFWNTYGKSIAWKNLFVSVPNLTLMFATWLMWSILAAQIQTAHDNDPSVYSLRDYVDYKDYLNPTQAELKQYKIATSTLPAIAGLVGATLRVVNTFMVAICGTRMHNTMNSIIAKFPMLGSFVVLSDKDCSFTSLVLLAGSSGIGGGAFASSVSSISFFFPKKHKGLALGLNGGVGNLGVSLSQLLVPVVTATAVFGPVSGEALSRRAEVWLQNAGLLYFILLGFFSSMAFGVMRTLPGHGTGSVAGNFVSYCRMILIGFVGGFIGVGLYIASMNRIKSPVLVITRIFVLSFVCCSATLAVLYIASPVTVQKKLRTQSAIFKDHHTWWQTYLYMMSLGSFIGYSSAFPTLIKNVFCYLPDGQPNPAMEGAVPRYAWMGPCVGSLARPAGGWLSDKLGSGATVTHWGTIVEVLATIGAAYFVTLAAGTDTPETYFLPFLACFLLLFCSTGSSNGSIFLQMTRLFEPEQAGPVLGWTSAVAAYGAAVFPAVFGATDDRGFVLYLFALYDFTCLVVNYYFYYRNGAPRPC